jgi:hypothetical protein
MKELKEDRRKIHLQTRKDAMVVVLPYVVNFYANKIRPNSQRMLDDLKYSDWAYAFEFNSYDFRAIPGRGHALGDWPRVGTALNRLDYDDYYNTTHYEIIDKGDPCGTMFGIDDVKETMWTIWRWTDIRMRLLTELGLDSEHFEFKNLAGIVSGDNRLFSDDRIPEYVNKVHLVYKQFPKKQ